MTLLLALDSAAGACSVAVARDGIMLAHEMLRMDRGHSETLVAMIARVSAAAGCRQSDIAVVAATVGPGSFTGVRIGLAAARGLALAVSARTVPVTSLEAIAHACGTGPHPLLVVLDSKRGDVYAQWFSGAGAALGGATAASPSAVLARAPASPIRVAGDAAPAMLAAAREAGVTAEPVGGTDVPDARSVAAIASRRVAEGGTGPLSPLYLRAPDVNLTGVATSG